MVPVPSEVAAHLRVGTPEEVADAVTRSHVADGRVIGWYGEPGTVIDAEVRDANLPSHLVARFGAADFLARWTRAECAAKLAEVPMHLWLRRHGLGADGADVATYELDDLVVSVAVRHTRSPMPDPAHSVR